ncbi:MAG: hypothetical protein CME88_03190 [Hirschia sp.]|nr:hypothetical protein [Hirschia sp.]MBF17363.1 hypothetical protein [Hirschia sp.]
MKVIGRDKVVMYDFSDEGRQVPGTGAKWQDSTWLHWWDNENSVGGVHRIGHEYNYEGEAPRIALWSNLVTPEGIYRHVLGNPLREADKLPNGWGGGDDTCRNIIPEEGVHQWIIDDPAAGVSADLVFKDYHAPFCGFPRSGDTSENIAPDHIDVGGSITGSITMNGKTFDVTAGQGVRDHGWGHRDIKTMLSHRYCAGTFGPDFTFCAWSIHNIVSDAVESFGWVVKGGDTVVFAKRIEIISYVEVDSASTRGGRIIMDLADGDTLDCELTAVTPGLVNWFDTHKFANNNTLCRAEANGRVGGGMFESMMNFHLGTRAPGRMQRALAQSGFYPGNFETMLADPKGPFAKSTVI